MNKKSTPLLCALLTILLECVAVQAIASIQYTGAISNTNGTLLGGGNWTVTGPTSLSWTVTNNGNGTWNYKYIFSHPKGETSHFLLEVSPNVTSLTDVALKFSNIGAGTASIGPGGAPSNPYIPGSFTNNLKFDGLTGLSTTIEFNIARNPTWGDFYSKNGNAGGHGVNYAFNSGFVAGDANDPLTSPLQNGPLIIGGLAHIMVPDSVTPPVLGGNPPTAPEPTSFLVWSLLAVCVQNLTSRRRAA